MDRIRSVPQGVLWDVLPLLRRLLDEDPVQSVVDAVVAIADFSTRPRNVQLVTDQVK